MSDAKQWLIGQEACEVISWNGSPISIEVPPFVELKKSDNLFQFL